MWSSKVPRTAIVGTLWSDSDERGEDRHFTPSSSIHREGLVVKDGKAAAEAPAESVPLMVKLITAGAKVPECRATIEMKPMVTAAPVDAA